MCSVHNKSTTIGLSVSVMGFAFKYRFLIYNHNFMACKSRKETLDCKFKTYFRRLIVHMAYIILYKHMLKLKLWVSTVGL